MPAGQAGQEPCCRTEPRRWLPAPQSRVAPRSSPGCAHREGLAACLPPGCALNNKPESGAVKKYLYFKKTTGTRASWQGLIISCRGLCSATRSCGRAWELADPYLQRNENKEKSPTMEKKIQKHLSGIHLGCIGASHFPPLPPHRRCRVLGWPGQEPPGAVPLCSCPRAPSQPLEVQANCGQPEQKQGSSAWLALAC